MMEEQKLIREELYKVEKVKEINGFDQFKNECNGLVIKMGRRVKNTKNQRRFICVLSTCNNFIVGHRYKLNFHPTRFKLTKL